MGYTKPYTYVNGTVLSADDHESNEESAKVYVNQEIEKADITPNSLETTDIANYRYISVGENFDFVTKGVYGNTDTVKHTNRSYFSATPKRNQQEVLNVIQWQHIEGGCVTVDVDRSNADIVITVYAHVIVNDNLLGVVGSPGQKWWQNQFALIKDDGGGIIDTHQYVFQGAGSVAAPVGLDANSGGNDASHRQFTFTYRTVANTAGRYRFALVCNPMAEIGYTTAKSITAEVFYI